MQKNRQADLIGLPAGMLIIYVPGLFLYEKTQGKIRFAEVIDSKKPS